MKVIKVLLGLFFPLFLSSCDHLLLKESDKGVIQVRNMQTKVIDAQSEKYVLRAVLSTLQDLGFIINTVDSQLGTVSATKLENFSSLRGSPSSSEADLNQATIRMTVAIRKVSSKQVRVRANIQHNLKPVVTPKTYQDFFAALRKSLYLIKHDL